MSSWQKLSTFFLRQEVHMLALQFCQVEEVLVWNQPKVQTPIPVPLVLWVVLDHSTIKLINVLWHSFLQAHQISVLYLSKSLPFLSVESVSGTQKVASGWKWATTHNWLQFLNPYLLRIMVSVPTVPWCVDVYFLFSFSTLSSYASDNLMFFLLLLIYFI